MSERQRGLFGFLRGDNRRLTASPAPDFEPPAPGKPVPQGSPDRPAGDSGPAPQAEPVVPVQYRPFPSSQVLWPAERLQGSEDVKIVVTGPFAAGKTTMVTKLGGPGAQVHTETAVSDETAALKAFTTVSLDFGTVKVSPPPGQEGAETRVQLFGTPGQERFEFMWRILAKGMQGYVVLVDTSRQFSVDDAKLILRRFKEISPGTPYVVGVSRWTGKGDPEKLARYLGIDPAHMLVSMREVDVREEAQSLDLLQHLLSKINSPAPV